MAYVLFAMICVIWSTSFILIKFATQVFGPVSVGAMRCVGGAAALGVVWAIRQRYRRRRGIEPDTQAGRLHVHHLPWLAAPVFIGSAYPFVMQPHLIGKHNHSALFGMMVALVPLLTILASVPLLRLWPRPRQAIGVAIGLACFVTLAGVGQRIGVGLGDLALAATVPAAYALSNTLVKRGLAGVDVLTMTTLMLICAGCVLVPIGLVREPMRVGDAAAVWKAIGSVAVLSVIGTGLASVGFFWLIQRRGPLFAGMVTYLVPVGALLWGGADRETITPGQVLALGGILAGVALVQWPGRRAPRPNPAASD